MCVETPLPPVFWPPGKGRALYSDRVCNICEICVEAATRQAHRERETCLVGNGICVVTRAGSSTKVK